MLTFPRNHQHAEIQTSLGVACMVSGRAAILQWVASTVEKLTTDAAKTGLELFGRQDASAP